MIIYDTYEVEDFLHDDFFIDWVLSPTAESNSLWANWLSEHPEKNLVIEKARIIVAAIGVKKNKDQLSDDEVDTIVNYIQENAFEKPSQKPVLKLYQRQWFRIAVMFLVFAAIGFIGYRSIKILRKTSDTEQTANNIRILNTTPESKLVRMNDGSLAVLTPGSEIQYSRLFTSAERNVYLEGEAFFEVHKDPKHPFLVHSQNMVTRVLGTSFTVKAFKNDAEFKVVVNTGKVWVYDQKNTVHTGGQSNLVTLNPNEQVIFKRSKLLFKKDTLPNPLILSKYRAKKEFTFINTQLITIINKLDKAYGVQIEYNKEALGKLTLTCSLSDYPLDEKVELICKAINAKCNFTDGRIIIEEEPQKI